MRLNRNKSTQQGDTLVEVMFAFAIFALVAVGSLTIMNQGIAAAQRSLEITLVRAQMDAQAEAIRYIHQAYVAAYQQDGPAMTGTAAEWAKMTNTDTGRGVGAASQFGQNVTTTCPSISSSVDKPFVVNAYSAEVWTGTIATAAPTGLQPPFSQLIYGPGATNPGIATAYGLWVEAVPSDVVSNGTGFVDFHIRACWSTPGSAVPATLGTIVRLYEPRS